MGKPLSSLVALSLCLGLAGCGNADEKESKQLANEAVAAANQGRLGEAEELLKEATSRYRDNHVAWEILGTVREQQKDWEGAAEAYSEAARVKDGQPNYHYKLGKAYANSKNISSAQSSLERAIELEPRLFAAHHELGGVYEKQGKPKLAAEAWTKAATANPTFGKSFINLGQLYIKWDKLNEAISVLVQGAMNVRGKDDLTNIYYALGLAYSKQGNWDKAIEAYTNAITQSSSNLDALRQRGFAYAEKKDVENAKKDLKAFVDQGGGGQAFHIQAANQRLFSLTANQ